MGGVMRQYTARRVFATADRDDRDFHNIQWDSEKEPRYVMALDEPHCGHRLKSLTWCRP